MLRVFFIFMLILAPFFTFQPIGAQEIGESGNPLPRFVSIATDKIFMRTGPGRNYPIQWVYTSTKLPLKVIEEYGPWRRVVDFQGVTGWMHRSLLSSRRTAMIIGGPQSLRTKPSITANINAHLQEGVIANIEECGKNWCKLQHPQVTGWLPRAGIYGVLDSEIID